MFAKKVLITPIQSTMMFFLDRMALRKLLA